MMAFALLALGACAAPVSKSPTALRSASAPIYSVAGLNPAQIVGRWVQVAAYQGKTACQSGTIEFTRTPSGLAASGRLCLDGTERRISGPVAALGSGRLSVPGMADWWVLWVDSGYRTMAIGTPSGEFGFILDRGELPPDRLAAAREIFEFNGYTSAALSPL